MPKIERAVIFAAGEGRRLRPVTLQTPKPLLPVNGERFIDTAIAALHSNGIEEIYIVTGYLGKQYETLPEQYPGVTLIRNPYYATCNNISSAYVARAHLANAIVSEADLIVRNAALCRREFDRSCYCAFPGVTPQEWGLTLDAAGTIINCDKAGLTGSHQLIGMSLWTEADAQRLCRHLERAFIEDRMWDVYWDELALFTYKDEYALTIREIAHTDIMEIDTLAELAAADASYAAYLQPRI